MIHLSYHPAFDSFHCIFRVLRIKYHLLLDQIEADKLRILDYYMLFPWRAGTVRLAQDDIGLRRIAKELEKKRDYATLPTGEILLERMRPAQTAALQTMVQDGVLDGNDLRYGIIRFKDFVIPDTLIRTINDRNRQEASELGILNVLHSYPLLGVNGLKDRTALLEHRYDKI